MLFSTCRFSGVRRKLSFKHAREVLGHLEPGFSARRPNCRASTLPFRAHKEAPKPLHIRSTVRCRNSQIASDSIDAQTAQPRITSEYSGGVDLYARVSTPCQDTKKQSTCSLQGELRAIAASSSDSFLPVGTL